VHCGALRRRARRNAPQCTATQGIRCERTFWLHGASLQTSLNGELIIIIIVITYYAKSST